jgi:hypothetical protein
MTLNRPSPRACCDSKAKCDPVKERSESSGSKCRRSRRARGAPRKSSYQARRFPRVRGFARLVLHQPVQIHTHMSIFGNSLFSRWPDEVVAGTMS